STRQAAHAAAASDPAGLSQRHEPARGGAGDSHSAGHRQDTHGTRVEKASQCLSDMRITVCCGVKCADEVGSSVSKLGTQETGQGSLDLLGKGTAEPLFHGDLVRLGLVIVEYP